LLLNFTDEYHYSAPGPLDGAETVWGGESQWLRSFGWFWC
jgi:hypothetical protein